MIQNKHLFFEKEIKIDMNFLWGGNQNEHKYLLMKIKMNMFSQYLHRDTVRL